MEWIKCSDQMPNHLDEVIVYGYHDGKPWGKSDTYFMEFDTASIKPYSKPPKIQFLSHDPEFSGSHYIFITHWMLSPKRPVE